MFCWSHNIMQSLKYALFLGRSTKVFRTSTSGTWLRDKCLNTELDMYYNSITVKQYVSNMYYEISTLYTYFIQFFLWLYNIVLLLYASWTRLVSVSRLHYLFFFLTINIIAQCSHTRISGGNVGFSFFSLPVSYPKTDYTTVPFLQIVTVVEPNRTWMSRECATGTNLTTSTTYGEFQMGVLILRCGQERFFFF